jgi:hypothetical protein
MKNKIFLILLISSLIFLSTHSVYANLQGLGVTPTCICNSMNIRTSGETNLYNNNRNPDTLGPSLEWATYPAYAAFRFEVETIISGDDPNACIIYQGIQDTWHERGLTFSKYGPAYNSSDNFGPDNPDSTRKNISSGKITWRDAPGYTKDLQEYHYKPDGVWYKLRFLTKVTGSDGSSCQQKFDIMYEANANGTVLTAPTLTMIGGGSSSGGGSFNGDQWGSSGGGGPPKPKTTKQ